MIVAPSSELVNVSHAPLGIICQRQARVLLVQSSAANASTRPQPVSLVLMDIIRVLLEFAPLARQIAGHVIQPQLQTVSLALMATSKPEALAQPVRIQIV